MSTRGVREINLGAGSHPNNFSDNTIRSSKYTLLTFVPKNLFEQFRRMVNFFFLSLIVIQVSIDIPVNPIPYAAAFAFVIGVTGIKQGYEDWCRHRADNKVNYADVSILTESGVVQTIKSQNLRVGQLIKLSSDEQVPCDLLLVACESNSGESQSYCQITTVNLDGESNLKMRFVPPNIDRILSADGNVSSDSLRKYFFRYDEPNSDLYNFQGQITSPTIPNPVHINMENILLRGSKVKNCNSVYAVAIYTGKDTRLSMNSRTARFGKFSTIEHTMNRIVIGMFLCLLILSGISVGLSFMYRKKQFDGTWYLPQIEDSSAKYIVTIFFSYLVLLCYMIPVSLSVTFELQKLGCSKFFSWDEEMICPETGAMPIVNTSDLNEELGQVEYLFTDKTGTLTDNFLLFRCCSINGVKYDYSDRLGLVLAKEFSDHLLNDNSQTAHCEKFLKHLAICHTVRVLPQKKNDESSKNLELIYQSNSLDEEILVKTAHRLGVKFLGGEENYFFLDEFGIVNGIKNLSTLEFDSDRKCMSIIVQQENGTFYLFCKGAETSVLPKCINSQQLCDITNKHVTDFAKLGLRTLVMAYKQLEEAEVTEFLLNIEKNRSNPDALKRVYYTMETNLTLLGCTGVEDRLQAGVPETLRKLTDAGIKIHILTGDKMETAMSVGMSCGIIETPNAVFCIEKVSQPETLRDQLKQFHLLPKGSVLVIDGHSFELAQTNSKDILQSVIIDAQSVIFCRMAPLQKSQVVNLVKTYGKKQFKTCAVGDGGNDCNMLRTAHLGIGIIGKEGLQAARESDFAIARFRFLQKAILVHGYWYYHRLANLITYFFYRGVFFIFQIFLYGFDSGFSAQTIFHSTFVMMFTIAFSSLPVLVQGLTEQPYSKLQLLNNPHLYKEISRNGLMSFKKCLRWYLVGLWHVVICYYVPKFVWTQGSSIDDYGSFSLFISSVIVIIADTKIILETRHLNFLCVIAQIFSFGSMIGFYMLLCHAIANGTGTLDFSYLPILCKMEVWITCIVVGILSLLPDLIYFSAQSISF